MCISHLIYTVRPCLIHTCHAMPMPCSDHAVLLKATARPSRDGRDVLWPYSRSKQFKKRSSKNQNYISLVTLIANRKSLFCGNVKKLNPDAGFRSSFPTHLTETK